MRVAALPDVHGNAAALEAVLAEVAGEQVDAIVFCGDLTWGPLPNETLELVRAITLPTYFVRGNARPDARRREGERGVWLAAQHGAEATAFVNGFPSVRRPRRGRARADALRARLAAQRRGVRDAADAGGAGARVHGGSPGARRRHGARSRLLRPAGGGGAPDRTRQRRPSLRGRSAAPAGRSSARTWSCANAGLRRRAAAQRTSGRERYRASGIRTCSWTSRRSSTRLAQENIADAQSASSPADALHPGPVRM